MIIIKLDISWFPFQNRKKEDEEPDLTPKPSGPSIAERIFKMQTKLDEISVPLTRVGGSPGGVTPKLKAVRCVGLILVTIQGRSTCLSF